MSAVVTSLKGQTFDDIVFENYGYAPQMLGPVIDANPDALSLGIHLPAGVEINLPSITAAPAKAEFVNLWN